MRTPLFPLYATLALCNFILPAHSQPTYPVKHAVSLVKTVDLPAKSQPFDVKLLDDDTLCLTYTRRNSLAFLDRKTFELKHELKLPFAPYLINPGPVAGEIYVTSPESSEIAIVDTKSYKVTGKIRFSMASGLWQIGFFDGGRRLAVTDAKNPNLYIIDLPTKAVVKTVRLSGNGLPITIAPKAGRAYVGISIPDDGEVSNVSVDDWKLKKSRVDVVNLKDFKVTSVSVYGFNVNALALCEKRNSLYVLTLGGSSLSVIDTNSNTLVSKTPLSIGKMGGTFVYDENTDSLVATVVENNGNQIKVLDRATLKTKITMPGGGPLVTAGSDGTIYSCHPAADCLTVARIK